MKNYITIFGAAVMLVLMSFAGSEFYSSMTKVDYVEGSKTLKFTTKIQTSHIAGAIKIDPDTAGFEAEVKKYVNNKFDVYVNGVPKNLTFTGSQVSGESLWVYFETSGVGDINNLKIRNAILLDTYPRQVNLVNISYRGSQKTLNYSRGKETNEVEF